MSMKHRRSIVVMLLSLALSSTIPIFGDIQRKCNCTRTRSLPFIFGKNYSVCQKLFAAVVDILPRGSTLLELGSGGASAEFSKYYSVWSVEHDMIWLNRYNTHYIYAPLVDNWYNVEILKKELPTKYDLILVDGPPGRIGRGKFLDHLDLFITTVPIIFDDVNRVAEQDLMNRVAERLGRKATVTVCGTKAFGVLLP